MKGQAKYTHSFRILAAMFLMLLGTSLASADLPNPGMQIDRSNTALVVTDPQNDFLSPTGVAWGVVGKSVTANNTVANIETLFKIAKASGIPVFVSPHYYFPMTVGGDLREPLRN